MNHNRSHQYALLFSFLTMAACGLFFPCLGFAQDFEERDFGFEANEFGSVWAGDLNSDNYLDVLVQDEGLTAYLSNKAESFLVSEIDISTYRRVDWLNLVDLKNTGRLDIFLSGAVPSGCCSTQPGTNIFSNLNGTAFQMKPSGVSPLSEAQPSWADMDGDNDADLLYSGDESEAQRIYRNDDGTLNEVLTADLPNSVFSNGSSVWADYDEDGDLDVLMAGGKLSYAAAVEIWRNDGNFQFSSVFEGVTNCGGRCSDAQWGDFDQDGDLDILVGRNIFRNDGSGNFGYFSTGIENYEDGFSSFIDFDADGDLDILVSANFDSGGLSTRFFEYQNGSYTSIAAPSIVPLENTRGAVFDFDRDGDDDFLFITGGLDYAQVKFFENKIITLVDSTTRPKLSRAKFNSKGLMTFRVSGIQEATPQECTVSFQFSDYNGANQSSFGEFLTNEDKVLFAAKGMKINSSKVEGFQMSACKACEGYSQACSPYRTIRPQGSSGLGSYRRILRKLEKKLDISEAASGKE